MIENWKPIVGFEGVYAVSDAARVKSLRRTIDVKNSGTRVVRERILKQWINDLGYLMVAISKDKVGAPTLVHRLVAAAFLGLAAGQEVDHADGDRKNNSLANLRVTNRFGNTQNAAVRRDNTSGVKGVSQCSRTDKWIAKINVSGAYVHIGRFDSLEDAAQARRAAELRLHGQFALANRPQLGLS